MLNASPHRKSLLAVLVSSSLFGAANAVPVDMELALLVDVSGSIDSGEFNLQRQGYAEAFENNVLPTIIRSGETGSIAATLIYWSGSNRQIQAVPWMQISDATSANAFAEAIDAAPRPFTGGTQIGSAINYAVPSFENDFEGKRKIIDISGDGASNSANTAAARDNALAAGIDNINGLVVGGSESVFNFYEQFVQGGPNSFTIKAETFSDFSNALTDKIGRETVPFDVNLLASRPDLNNIGLDSYRVTSGQAVPTPKADSSLPTIVLTHGWQPGGDFNANLNAGFFPLPELKEAIGAANDAEFNLITYHWKDAYTETPLDFGDIAMDPDLWMTVALGGKAALEAHSGDWISAGLTTIDAVQQFDDTLLDQMIEEATTAFSKTHTAGENLAIRLIGDLGFDYAEPLHFIGHSHGTAVNSYAISALNALIVLPQYDINVTQNTLLDPALVLPAFDADLFYSTLPTGSVDFVDNFYALPLTGGTGRPIANTNPPFTGDLVGASHNKIHSEYYAGLISAGDWQSSVFGSNTLAAAGYQEWTTPKNIEIIGDLSADAWQSIFGLVSLIGDKLGLSESSPASVVQEVSIPFDASIFEFGVMWENIGDGDWLTLHFNDQLLWTYIGIEELIGNMLTASVPISQFAGQTGSFFLTLNSVNDVNASVILEDFRFTGVRALNGSVPEPATLLLMGLGLAGLGFVRRRKNSA